MNSEPVHSYIRSRSAGLPAAPRPIVSAATILLLLMSPLNVLLVEGAQKGSADSLKRLSLEQLGNIEVTSVSKEPEEIRRVAAAIHVITQEDIRRSGATTIPEILRLAPGVHVSRINSNHWAVGVRGFGDQFSKAVLVLIDGRSVYTPLFAGVFWDVQDTLISDIDRIEVIRGPGGTIWGANAFNGVVNIITKAAKDTHGTTMSIGGGNVDQGLIGFRHGIAGNGAYDSRVYGKFLARAPEFHPDNKDFDHRRVGQLGFRIDWNGQTFDRFTLQGDAYKGAEGERAGIASFSPPSQVIVDADTQVSGGNFMAQWRRELSATSDMQVGFYYDRTTRSGIAYKEARDTFDVDFVHHIGRRWRQDFSWGLGARLSPSEFTQRVEALDFNPHENTAAIYSGFVQDEIEIVQNRLALTIGAKLEHNNYTGLEVQPSGRLLWTPDSRQTYWGAVTRAVRTPSRLDTEVRSLSFFQANPLTYLEIHGNPNLKSEELVGYEIGFRRALGSSIYVDASAFHNDYRNMTSYAPARASIQILPVRYVLGTIPYSNGVRGSTNGFEIGPSWQPSEWWHLKTSYSGLRMNLEDKSGNLGAAVAAKYEGSSPRHMVSVQSRLNLPKGFETDQTYRYVSALPGQIVSAYSTADLRVSRNFGESIEFSIVGQNLLHPHHVEFGTPASAGIKRSIYATMTWKR